MSEYDGFRRVLRGLAIVLLLAALVANCYAVAIFGSNLDPLSTTLRFAMGIALSLISLVASFLVAQGYLKSYGSTPDFVLLLLGILLVVLGVKTLITAQGFENPDSDAEKNLFIRATWNECCSEKFGLFFNDNDVLDVQIELSSGVCKVVDVEGKIFGAGKCEEGSITSYLESMPLFLLQQFNIIGALTLIAGAITSVAALYGFAPKKQAQAEIKQEGNLHPEQKVLETSDSE